MVLTAFDKPTQHPHQGELGAHRRSGNRGPMPRFVHQCFADIEDDGLHLLVMPLAHL